MYDNFAELYAIVKATERVEKAATASASASTSAAIVAEGVQNFVTAILDSLKRNMMDVDQFYPLLSDRFASLNKLTILPPNFDGKTKMKEWIWIARLSKMDCQLHFDFEFSYNSFMAALLNAGT